jgi:hypothetical protein
VLFCTGQFICLSWLGKLTTGHALFFAMQYFKSCMITTWYTTHIITLISCWTILSNVWLCLTFRNCAFCTVYTYVLNFLNMLHSLHFFSLQNAIYFLMLPFLVPALFAFYIQSVPKFKCQIPVPKGCQYKYLQWCNCGLSGQISCTMCCKHLYILWPSEKVS